MEEELYDELRAIDRVHWWLVVRRRIFLRFLREAAGRMPGRPLVLDCGFGTGSLMDDLNEFALPVGVDRMQRAVVDCRRQGHLQTVRAEATSLPFGPATFDMICAFDVLEHLDDDLAALAHWREKLRPGGYLFLSVPAYNFLWDAQDDMANHRRRYLLGQLRGRLRRAGFTVRKITYFNTLLFPALLCTRLVRKAQMRTPGGRPVKSDFSLNGPGLVNRALLRIFASEIALLGRLRFPFGGSIFSVAQPG